MFNNEKSGEYTESTFGKYIRERREKLGLSVRQLAEIIEMTPVYLSDIERGNRNVPDFRKSKKGIDYMAKLIEALQIQKEDLPNFYDMAEVSLGNYRDIHSYLKEKPTARIAIRLAAEKGASDNIWEEIITVLNKLNTKDTNADRME